MRKYKYHRQYHKEQLAPSYQVDKLLLKRLLQYLKPYKYWLSLALVVLIISKAIESSVPLFIGKITQQILDARGDSVAVQDEFLSKVLHYGLFIFGLLFTSYLLDAFNVFLKNWIGQKALLKMRLEVLDHIHRLPLKYFDHHPVGTLMTRTINDVDQINQMFSESVIPILGNIFLFLSMLICMIWLNWHLAALFGCALPFVWWLAHNFRLQQRRCYEIARTIVSSMNAFVQEQLMGLSIVHNFGSQKREQKKFEEINDDYYTAYLESINNFSFFISSIGFMQMALLIMTFAGLVIFAPEEGFQGGTYFTFSLYIVMFFSPLADLAERYNVLQSAMASSSRIFHVLDQGVEATVEGAEPSLEEITSIVFNDVWFAYEKEQWVLKGISFSLQKGESVAFVGMTGSGKTTILSLLLRFYDIKKGSILINGRDIKEYPLQNLRKQFSVVLQDPVLFSASIADNISLYSPNITEAQIQQAIEYVNMGKIINKFPDGLKHTLTERGGALSAGEMQLLSLARAVAHERSVIILDEATANIDTKTERIIQESLKKIFAQKTSLVIAHRLSTIQHVSRIIVLHHGEIKEAGTHHELLQAHGIYEKLYKLQFIDLDQSAAAQEL